MIDRYLPARLTAAVLTGQLHDITNVSNTTNAVNEAHGGERPEGQTGTTVRRASTLEESAYELQNYACMSESSLRDEWDTAPAPRPNPVYQPKSSQRQKRKAKRR